MQFNYKEEETAANIVRAELMDLLQQFSVVAGRYKSALTEFYLANTQKPQGKLFSESMKVMIRISTRGQVAIQMKRKMLKK